VVDTADTCYTTSFSQLYHECQQLCTVERENHRRESHLHELKLTEYLEIRVKITVGMHFYHIDKKTLN